MAKKKDEVDTLLESIRKKHGDDSIMLLGGPIERVAVIPSGCLSLDVATGVGGYPRGRVIEIIGPESSGKTTLTLHAIASAQAEGGRAAFVDAEHALDRKYAEALGVHTDKLILSQPSHGEQALSIVEELVDSSSVDLIVVDSVAALVPKSEIDGEMGDAQMGAHARLMSQAMRKLVATAAKHMTTIIFINQIRMRIGVMYGSPETTTGGNALKFYASMRIDVRKKQQVKDAESNAVGNETLIKVIKNKLAPPFREAPVEIIWGKGIDRVGDVLSCAVTTGLIQRNGAWFSYGDLKLAQGFNKAADWLRENGATLREIESKLRKELLP